MITKTPRINLYQTKGKKSFVSTYRSKNAILTMPVIQDTDMPTIKSIVMTEGFEIIWGSLSTAAPKIIGVDSKKENRAAPSRVSPIINPVVMVIPERETPGITARA